MSIEIIKKQINRFLESENPEVLAIKGDWGVGKTFAWDKFIRESAANNSIALKKYAYISLFGIGSLENLKFSIFEQVIDIKDIETKPSLVTLRKSTERLGKSLGRKSVRLLQGLPYIRDIPIAVESISFLSLSKTIICIDDIERKGENLKIKDVLGLASILKEQKECKVVLILNDESLDEKEEENLSRFREKVIDMELFFSPTAEECADIAIYPTDHFSEKLKELSILLNINNIRVIRKTVSLASKLVGLLDTFEPEVAHQAIHTLILYNHCHLNKDNESIPSYDYVKNIGHKLLGIDDEERTEQQKNWNSFLSSYSYQTTDEFDLEIGKGIERGYFDEEELVKHASILNDRIVANKSEGSFTEAWAKYHDTFEDNEADLVESIHRSFCENAKYISAINLNGSVKLLRDLDRNDLANDIIDIYIATHNENPKVFDINSYPFSGDITDSDIIRRFSEEYDKHSDQRTLEQVIESLVGKNGWNRADIDILKTATTDDFYRVFTQQRGKHLGSWIEVCLQFKRIRNAGDEEKAISTRATEALARIGQQSRLNARRVSKFGVDIKSLG